MPGLVGRAFGQQMPDVPVGEDLVVYTGTGLQTTVADMLVDLDAAIVDRQVREIREIEETLKRLAELDFGDCIECGGEIGFERLLAYPTARRCVRCQSLHEKTYSHEPNPTL